MIVVPCIDCGAGIEAGTGDTCPDCIAKAEDATVAKLAAEVSAGIEWDSPTAAKKKAAPKRKKARKLNTTDGGWDLAARVLETGQVQNLLLYGPPGTGKSRFAKTQNVRESGYVRGPKAGPACYAVYLTEETPASDLRGGPLPVNGKWTWTHGPGVLAKTRGVRLVLDEVDKASADTLTFLLALLDDADVGGQGLSLPNGEVIYPAEGFHVVATSNMLDKSELPEALADRFTVAVNITKPHPDGVAALPPDLHVAATNSANLPPERRVSLRGWQAFAALRDELGPEAAAAAVFGTRAKDIVASIGIAAAPTDESGTRPDCWVCAETAEGTDEDGNPVCYRCGTDDTITDAYTPYGG